MSHEWINMSTENYAPTEDQIQHSQRYRDTLCTSSKSPVMEPTPEIQRPPDTQSPPETDSTPGTERPPETHNTPESQTTPEARSTANGQSYLDAESSPETQSPPVTQATPEIQNTTEVPYKDLATAMNSTVCRGLFKIDLLPDSHPLPLGLNVLVEGHTISLTKTTL